jgi:hypothetical protein
MAKKRFFRIAGGWSAVIVLGLGMSYCSEATKHRFEDRAAESNWIVTSLDGAQVLVQHNDNEGVVVSLGVGKKFQDPDWRGLGRGAPCRIGLHSGVRQSGGL